VRDDEAAATLVSVNTREVKILAFVISSFFAGIAGGLFAHLIQFINPRTFSLIKSTTSSLCYILAAAARLSVQFGSDSLDDFIGALRFLGIWRFVVAPIALIVLMIYRPLGIMGGRELRFLIPKDKSHGSAK